MQSPITHERILDIFAAPAGWFNVYLTNAEPGYVLSPVAVFAEVATFGFTQGASDHVEKEQGYVGLDGVHIITCPSAGIGGYFGAVHSSEITKSVQREWENESRWRQSDHSLDLGQGEQSHTEKTFTGEPVKLVDVFGHAGFFEGNVKTMSRVPAAPGWFNVYLLDASPWYVLRPVVLWILERRRFPSGFFWNLWGKRYPNSFIWGRYGEPRVIGIDGRLEQPDLGYPGNGFLEMTHESVITPQVRSEWESLARAKPKSTGKHSPVE